MLKEPVVCLVAAYKGMVKKDLYTTFPPDQEKEYRRKGSDEWITFADRFSKEAGSVVTFHLMDGRVKEWS